MSDRPNEAKNPFIPQPVIRAMKEVYQSPVHDLDAGTLFVVPTPIGNIEDLTLRSIRILGGVDWIAAEDTRHTGLLLSRIGIKKQLFSLHQFNESGRSQQLVELLRSGQRGALVTDAGTPGISDPGQRFVRDIVQAGISLMALPGACAIPVALSASGFVHSDFFFAGFPPMKSGQRIKRMQSLAAIESILVFYESPHKMPRFLSEAYQVFPTRPIIIGRELTKKFEEYIRGSVTEIHEKYQTRSWKGEMVILIDNTAGTS
ncbi:MAG: 16S rRNA (cytidine(1402)-2'-O)-methyltransferase [Verrucomicrobia bacterium]|nr:16S rRNA (cytidine(1402)-2'-O)-methyltransferase [Verrucomicrobiota bacterium]